MRVMVNGQFHATEATGLLALRDSLYGCSDDVVMIFGGYQTTEDRSLQEDDEIIFIAKGKLPPEDQLEQMMMARHTPGVHEKVKQARVAVAGLGGLGSHIAVILARTGVGHLHLVDFDVVEPSNLNRQQYRISHLGMAKAEALKREIAEINPYVTVLAERIRVSSDNAIPLFRGDDIVCEAFDDATAKAMLVNRMLECCPEKAIVAASGLAGYGSGNAIRTRRIRGRFYLCGDGEAAAEPGRGLMAPRVAICAGHQANMVLRLILGEEDV